MDYCPQTDEQIQEMLRTIGVGSFDELIQAVPADVRVGTLDVPEGLAEADVIALGEQFAGRNRAVTQVSSFLGAGCYAHLIPAAVDALASRGEWLTPYTPYQAEASQGTLQAIYEFQTLICELFQMDVANASLYDGASSVAEAVLLSIRATGRSRVLISEALHPHARQVLATYLSGTRTVIQEIPTVNGVTDLEALGRSLRARPPGPQGAVAGAGGSGASLAGDDVACVVLQQPNVFGCLEPMAQAGELAHRVDGLFVASVYPVSLGLLQPPGAYGADIAVAEGRCLGSPMAYGGPGLGLCAATSSLMRRLPGRLAGCTVDRAGRRGYTLTLQTREQHIRREKATSNICTNEGWLALRATIFLSLLGKHGMREMASLNAQRAHYAVERLREIPWVSLAFDQPFFNEFTLTYEGVTPARVNRLLAKTGIVGGLPLGPWFPTMPRAALWCVTELVNREAIDRLVETMKHIA